MFFGLKAAVLAIVIEAVVRIGSRALRSRAAIAVAASAFVAIFFLGVPFPLIVFGASVVGYFVSRSGSEVFCPGGHGCKGRPGRGVDMCSACLKDYAPTLPGAASPGTCPGTGCRRSDICRGIGSGRPVWERVGLELPSLATAIEVHLERHPAEPAAAARGRRRAGRNGGGCRGRGRAAR